jgi:hypothetical protein
MRKSPENSIRSRGVSEAVSRTCALYQMIRTHALSERSPEHWTAAECLGKAVETIRETSPDFEPILSGSLETRP